MPYVPGLDGLRALAVVAILLFHMGVSWMPGAVFSVTLFFTLSGYLVTSLVLVEHDGTGRLDLRRFWARRFRRLMPAALFTLSAVGVAGIAGLFEGERLRGDLGWALGYLSNWRSASASTGYSDLFTSETSPLLHFWSLAIEEQFYIVFPLLAWLLLRRRRLMMWTFAAIAVLGTVAMVATSSRNLAYYGTHTRLAELAVGVVFAFVFPVRKVWGPAASRWWSASGLLALGLFIALLVGTKSSDPLVYDGALAGFAVVATLMIAAVSVEGPMRRVFSWRPLVEIGKVSYPAYLVHWPVIVALDEERLGFGGLGMQVVRVAATAVLTVFIARLVEMPIRTRRIVRTRASTIVAVILGVLVTAAITVAVPARPLSVLAGVDAPDEVVNFDDSGTPGGLGQSTTIPEPRSPLLLLGGVAVLASDVATNSGDGFKEYDYIRPECAIRLTRPTGSDCEPFRTVASRGLAASGARVVVVGVGADDRVVLDEGVERTLAQPDNTLPGDFALIDESEKMVDRILQPLLGSVEHIVIVDYTGGDYLWDTLVDADLRYDEVVVIDATAGDFGGRLGDEFGRILGVVDDSRDRVMVIGDSTSFGLAQAIHNVAGERYEVVWAGGRNCPLVEVERVKWWDGVDFAMDYCPTLESTWREMITGTRPDLLIEIASVPEQAEQRYPGDETWYSVEDPEFVERHDAVMTELVSLVESVGGRFVLFDSPSVHGDSLGNAPFSQPERIAAWNAMLAEWAERWPQIEMIGWADIVAAAETVPGELRTDDVHMEQADLDDVVREYVLPLLDRVMAGETLPYTGPTMSGPTTVPTPSTVP